MSEETVSGVKPSNYGEWWNTNAKEVAWYQDIHDARASIHEAFMRWFAEHDRLDDPIRSVLEIGCGRGVRYPALFADRRYVGYDISRKEIEWCRTNLSNPRHEYILGDFIADGIGQRFDLVFAHAVIDHVYDVDAFLRAALRATNRWVYLTAYRGWFPDLREHRYSWSDQDTCFFNDLSPTRVQGLLTALGCRSVRVAPSEAVIQPAGRETVVIAERPEQSPEVRKADDTWLLAVVACPACLERGILDDRRDHPTGRHYRCGRCHRIYPVDNFGRIDFRVHDRLASLPPGALEMWTLARHRSREEPRRGSHALVSRHEAATRLTDFVSLDESRVLDVGSGTAQPPVYLEGEKPRQFVALGPATVERDVPHTSVQAWPELMPFAAETFDVVVCWHSLEQVLCLESSLREFHRVLRRDGTLCLRLSFVPDTTVFHKLYPPLLVRAEGDVLVEGEGFQRREAALDEETRRTRDFDRLESEFGHLLADGSDVRHLPLRVLKTMPSYGFQPEVIDVWDHDWRGGRLVLNSFVRLRKSERGTPIDRAVVHQVDLLVETTSVSERLTAVREHTHAISERLGSLERVTSDVENLRASVNEVRADLVRDLESAVRALRQAIDYPRTPFERVYRRLSRWLRRQGPRTG